MRALGAKTLGVNALGVKALGAKTLGAKTLGALAAILWAGTVAAAGPQLRPAVLFTTAEWKRDDHRAALDAFLSACAVRRPARALAFATPTGLRTVTDADWRRACTAGGRVGRADRHARVFFEQEFTPYRLGAPGRGMFLTGYYLPVIRVARERSPAFPHAIYGLPAELASDPSAPFFTRAAIDAGALDGRGLELLWTDDPVMRFFLQIQGSGYGRLPDGRTVQLRYAGKNNQPYVAIGRQLVAEGALRKEDVSLQTIRDWLHAHPARQVALMESNPSYVFFSLAETPGPVTGASGTPLVPGRSLAIDPAFYPYRLPIFLRYAAGAERVSRTMIAADAGSAITGPGRADVYHGDGASAEAAAGGLKAEADAVLLLPRRGD